MNKPIHPAVAEHVMEENERLRGLLRQLRALLANSSYRISGTAAFLHSIEAALSRQAEPKCSTCNDVGVVGHSMICPECEETWTPSVEPIEQVAAQTVYVECRECAGCGHIGINDSLDTNAACDRCAWIGPSPAEDTCPGCAADNVMSAACPKCGCIYRLLADAEIATRPAQTEQQPSTARQVLDLILEECRYWQGRDEARRGGFACLYAKAKEIADNAAPVAQTAPAQVTAAMWKAAHDSMESDGDLALALQEALNAAHGQTTPQPDQSGLVEALKRIQCLMADREAQALDGSQDRQLFVTILNIADAALSPSIPATYSCDYAGCCSKAYPGTSLCLAHHSPKNRAALSAQGASK